MWCVSYAETSAEENEKKEFFRGLFQVKSQYYPGGSDENHEILIYLNLTCNS
jgi:hypothetical protein